MDIREVVKNYTKNQMSARPGYYAGRGATTTDLNAELLNQIAEGIKKEFGKQAHDAYVKMVWKIPTLSATIFLTNLYALHDAGWVFSEEDPLLNNGNSIESHDEAWGLMAQVVSSYNSSGKINATDSIRRGFRKVM